MSKISESKRPGGGMSRTDEGGLTSKTYFSLDMTRRPLTAASLLPLPQHATVRGGVHALWVVQSCEFPGFSLKDKSDWQNGEKNAKVQGRPEAGRFALKGAQNIRYMLHKSASQHRGVRGICPRQHGGGCAQWSGNKRPAQAAQGMMKPFWSESSRPHLWQTGPPSYWLLPLPKISHPAELRWPKSCSAKVWRAQRKRFMQYMLILLLNYATALPNS